MYRNIAYRQESGDGVIYHFTYDENGKRIVTQHTVKPYYYRETSSKKATHTSIYNTKLEKISFDTEYERNVSLRSKAGEDRGVIRVYENLRIEHQFLIDYYWKQWDNIDPVSMPLKVWFLDIEVYSPDEFPEANKAAHPVNIITIYDTIDEKYYSWGYKNYKPKLKDHVFFECENERDMFQKFLEFQATDYPDVISGWNSEFFDLPYIINRIAILFDDDEPKRLSPVGRIRAREIRSAFGKLQTKWTIDGVSCVDYIDVYKTFTQAPRESYKLNSIAEVELGEKKIDYGESNLAALADRDWDLFVDYNVQDVRLLVRLDAKLLYIKLLRTLAFVGLTPLENALGTISTVTGAAIIEARRNDLIIPTFIRTDDERNSKYEGAYVSEPQRGFQEYLVSFDANSLYPSVMISLNLSPETKFGSIVSKNKKEIIIRDVNNNDFKLSPKKFLDFCKKEKISISKADKLFLQKKKGIFPSITEKFYAIRQGFKREWDDARAKLNELKKEDPEYKKTQFDVERLWIQQLTYKILINRIYGYFGNKASPMGDPDIARSITLTGQGVIKQSNKILTSYVQEKTGMTDEDLKKNNPIIYNDTDSVYVTIKSIIEHKKLKFANGKDVTEEIYNLVEDIENVLNNGIQTWSESILNSIDSRFKFKRESICDSGLFLQKKRYVLHKLDDEGLKTDKFKYTGVEVVRSTMPNPIKPLVKEVMEEMILSKDYVKINNMFNNLYKTFKALPIEDYALVMGVSNYDHYAFKCQGFKTVKGMPIHVKSAYFYNLLLEKLDLKAKYEPIVSGDKIRFLYVETPNKFGIKTIAYKYSFPEEFKSLLKPDIDTMFEKIVCSVFERCYEAVNWQFAKPGQQVKTNLFELFN